jgi:hypothetical protein
MELAASALHRLLTGWLHVYFFIFVVYFFICVPGRRGIDDSERQIKHAPVKTARPALAVFSRRFFTPDLPLRARELAGFTRRFAKYAEAFC